MPAELFSFPPRRDGAVPPDAVAILRRLAKDAAEAGADPQTAVSADLELLLVCDTLILLMRQYDDAMEIWRDTTGETHREAWAEARRRRLALRPAMVRATKCRASTPVGLFAKAAAVRRLGNSAAGLAVSLADDLLASPELRATIWPPAHG